MIVGIAGGTGSGKSWLAHYLQRELGELAVVISQDWYYRNRGGMDTAAREDALNFDHPRAIDTPLLAAHLDALRQGRPIEAPQYDYATHARTTDTRRVSPAPLLVLEGILVLCSSAVRRRLDYSVFVDTPADLRLIRRLRRDVADRAISFEETIRLYETFARPMHDRFVQPCAARADHVWNTQRDSGFPKQFAARARRWCHAV